MAVRAACHSPRPDDAVTDDRIDWDALVDCAVSCRKRAYAPYSGFRVGAALLAANGLIYTGCNVENRVLGLSLCAERGALSAAIAAGQSSFRALALATGAEPPSTPCGQCRDALAEFSRDLPILSVTAGARGAASRKRFTLSELLPERFVLDPPQR